MVSIAIDGPSGAGKSSLAKALAKDMGYVYVDTGAMYRSIGLYAVRAGVDPHDAAAVTALLPEIQLDIRLEDGTQHIYLNGEDVSTAIRAENIGMAASAVAAHPAVRSFLLDTQRGLAESQNILMDGRDIGTVVLPNATVKIFLTASAEARAQRRAKELAEKGQPADFATVLADIRQRDYQDSHRAVAQAICRLDPPVRASTSRISPAKYRPSQRLLAIVLGSTSRTSTPPAVITACSLSPSAVTRTGQCLHRFTSACFCSRVICAAFAAGSTPHFSTATGRMELGSSLASAPCALWLPSAAKSRVRRS